MSSSATRRAKKVATRAAQPAGSDPAEKVAPAQPYTFKVIVRDERGRPTGEILECPACALSFQDLKKLQPWVDAQIPDPFDVVAVLLRKGDYTVPQQQFLLDKAMERACSRALIGTPEGDRLLHSMEGVKEMLGLAIRKAKPDFPESDEQKLFASMTPAELMEACSGLTS